MLDLRPSGLTFRIMCLGGSVSSFISHSQEVLLAQFSLGAKKWPKTPIISFHFNLLSDPGDCDVFSSMYCAVYNVLGRKYAHTPSGEYAQTYRKKCLTLNF